MYHIHCVETIKRGTANVLLESCCFWVKSLVVRVNLAHRYTNVSSKEDNINFCSSSFDVDPSKEMRAPPCDHNVREKREGKKPYTPELINLCKVTGSVR